MTSSDWNFKKLLGYFLQKGRWKGNSRKLETSCIVQVNDNDESFNRDPSSAVEKR